jgi:hypothetical protein
MIVIQYHHFMQAIDAVTTLAIGIKESLIMSHELFLVCKQLFTKCSQSLQK